MLNILRQKWWKILGIVFLFYAISAGLALPLSPGIQAITPTEIVTGTQSQVEVYGYNTHFAEGDASLILHLTNDDFHFCTTDIEVHNEQAFTAHISIPENISLPRREDFFNAVIISNTDGSILMRRALKIKQGELQEGVKIEKKDFCSAHPIELKLSENLSFPYREILYETIRNLFFHVPMWFAMTLLLLVSFIASIKYLGKGTLLWDLVARYTALTGLFFGILGILTGMFWANFTWGAPWVNDPKLNGAAVGILIYLAYFVLRSSVTNPLTQKKIAAVYNIFSFVLFIVFIFILPRMTDSLHPGSGGNPGFNTYDLDNTMRPVFYSAVLGFFLIGMWMSSLLVRIGIVKDQQEQKEWS